MIEPFFFERDYLRPIAEKYGPAYNANKPFAHTVIDDFLPPDVLDRVLAEFPSPGEGRWDSYKNSRENKLANRDEALLAPFTRHLFNQFNSSVFLEFLEQLTGIEGLIADPYLVGGGLHQIERGGHLKVHSDFNWHDHLRLDRRLNILVYLNKDWEDDFGGHLELWDKTVTRCEKKVLPVFNRCVVFSTTDYSFHGHPEPLNCPPDRTRKSMALYYYSNGRPAEEFSTVHSTDFQPRPGEVWRRDLGGGMLASAVRYVPPVLVDWGREMRRRRQEKRHAGGSGSPGAKP